MTITAMTTDTRKSNIELLRIISMLAIVMLHLGAASVGLPQPKGNLQVVTAGDIWILTVEAFSIIGVNCFALISGYFGIKARFGSFAKLTVMCVFYAVGIYSLFVAIGNEPWSWTNWLQSWLVYSHTDLWYVPAYLGLFLLSPLLNSTDYGKWHIAGFILFNVWCGWLWHGGINPTGYTIIQLIMMYVIGRYIHAHVDLEHNKLAIRHMSLATYVACTITIVIMSLYADGLFTFAYNSPLVLVSSVSLFLFFATLDFKSVIINQLATAAFAVYLVHKHPFIFARWLKPLSRHMWDNMSLVEYTLAFIALTLAIYLLIFVIDRLRTLLFNSITTMWNTTRHAAPKD